MVLKNPLFIILSLSFAFNQLESSNADFLDWFFKMDSPQYQRAFSNSNENQSRIKKLNNSKVEIFAKALNNSISNFKISWNENTGDIMVDEISDLSVLTNYERELYNAIVEPSKTLKLAEIGTADKDPLRPLKKSKGVYTLEIKLWLLFGDKSSSHQKEIGRILFGSALREFNTGNKQEGINFEVGSFYTIYDMTIYEAGSKKVWQFNTGVSYTRTINLGVIEYKYMDHLYFKVNMHKDEAYRNNLRATQGSYMPVQVWKK